MTVFGIPMIGGRGWPGGWNYMRMVVRSMSEFGPSDIHTIAFVGPEAPAHDVAEMAALSRTGVVIDPEFSESSVRTGVGSTLMTGRNDRLLTPMIEHGCDVALAAAILLGRKSPVASIAWLPDFQQKYLPHLFPLHQRLRRELGFRTQIAEAAAVLLSSKDAERDCLKFYPGAAGKTVVAKFAASLVNLPSLEEAQALVAANGIEPGFICLPNQLWMHKNHEVAIEAAAILKRRGNPRTIVATGSGVDHRRQDWAEHLHRKIAAANVGDRFRMLGSVDYQLVQSLILTADALLQPSRFEGWSTTIEEAKACGTPVVLSDLPVHREQAERNAKFFNVDDPNDLADAIEATPLRSHDVIADDLSSARMDLPRRQRAFVDALVGAIHIASVRASTN